jgi:capsular exopolysaccharide synthesis family protein
MRKKPARESIAGLSMAQARESFGKIKVNLEFLSVDNNYRCILLSSSVAGEGKSTVAANLAISLAASERKVLLIDADLRKPSLHRMFDLINKVGLSDIIANDLDWRRYANDTNVHGLSLITAGRVPPNPSELLGSNRMGELVGEFKQDFDIILFDSSPILLVPDPISLCKHIDGIVVVARQNFTTQQAVISTREALRMVSKPVIGTILNNVTDSEARYGYGYGKSYGGIQGYYRIIEQQAAGQRAGK